MSTLFVKVLNMSLTAGWLILAVMVSRWLLKRAPRRIICLLWTFVAVRLILPFSLQSAVSLIPSSRPIPADIALSGNSAIDTGISFIDNAINSANADNPATDHAESSHPASPASLTPRPEASVNPMQVVWETASRLWLVGIAAMLLYALLNYLRLKKRLSAAVEVRTAGEASTAVEATATEGNSVQKAGGRVMACSTVKSPFILGVLKPVIYVPAEIPDETLENVIRHERMHLARWDNLWKPLAYLILAVHWFNPLCWAAYVLFSRDVEMACDEAVIKDMERPQIAAYMNALLACSQPGKIGGTVPLAFGEVGTKQRILHIMHYKKTTFAVLLAVIVMSLGMAACLMTDPIDETVQEPSYGAFITQTASPYMDADSYLNDQTRLYHFQTRDGSPLTQGTELLQYLEESSGDWQILCKDPNCLHASEECPAYYAGRHELLDVDLSGHIRVLEFAKAGHMLVIWNVDSRKSAKSSLTAFDLDELTDTQRDGSARLSDFCEYNGKLYVTYPVEGQDKELTWLIRVDLQTMQTDSIVCLQPSLLPTDYDLIHRFEYVENNTIYIMLENADSGQLHLYGFDMEKLKFADTRFALEYRTNYCLAGRQAVYCEKSDEQYYLVETDVLTGESRRLAETSVGTVVKSDSAQYLGFVNIGTRMYQKSGYYQLNLNTGEMTEYFKEGERICRSCDNGYAAYFEFTKDYGYRLVVEKVIS